MGVVRRGSDVTSHVSSSGKVGASPCLQHFSVIRSIGRGAFGKVCIVQERKTKKYFALKYMNKRRCIEKVRFTAKLLIVRSLSNQKLQGVAANVIRELTLLSKISHPFIVNLWYTFQVILRRSNQFFHSKFSGPRLHVHGLRSVARWRP